jgi:LEA14-like dessication related protein
MKKIFRIGFVLLIILFIAGELLFVYRDRVKKYFIPVIDQIGEIHIEIKNDTAYLSSQITAENKSFLHIEIDTLTYNIKLANKTYMEGRKLIGFKLNPYGMDTIDFAIKIPYAAILKDMNAQRKLGDSTSYAISLYLQYSTIFGKHEAPIRKSSKLKIPQPPELEIVDIKYNKVKLKSIHADVKIKIKNYNTFALKIDAMDYAMLIAKQGKLKGTYNDTIDIKPKGETFVNLPIEIDFVNIGRTLWDVITDKDKSYYSLTVNATLESAEVKKKIFHIDLTKEGIMEIKK